MKKKFGKIKIKRIKAGLDQIPEDCGYEKRFTYDIDMNSNGIMSECIEWCQTNCKSKWGCGSNRRIFTIHCTIIGRNRTVT